MSLADLREHCGGQGYPGVVLDIAGFIKDVREGLQRMEDGCT